MQLARQLASRGQIRAAMAAARTSSALSSSSQLRMARALLPSAPVRSFSVSEAAAFSPPPRRNLSVAATPNAEPLRQLHGVEEAVEVIDALPAINTKLMLTCEHASVRLPEPWQWPSGDSRLLGMHWSHDAGADEFTRELSKRLPSVAVLARFSRLLCDANRPLGSDTMFRKEADGKPVQLNSDLNDTEIQRRVDTLYKPYHRALKNVAEVVKPSLVLSVHSFTPEYEGQPREVEIGVLYKHDKDRALADKFMAAYAAIGVRVALNEPWSAKEGFAYAADQFNSLTCASIMLELRQDLAVQQDWRQKVLQATIQVLNEAGHK